VDDRPEYVLRLRAMPSGVPPHLRLKHLLKLALRKCQLRAVSIEQVAGPRAATSQVDKEENGR
jgi:hypothetical protein